MWKWRLGPRCGIKKLLSWKIIWYREQDVWSDDRVTWIELNKVKGETRGRKGEMLVYLGMA